jgi:hypothetical protein
MLFRQATALFRVPRAFFLRTMAFHCLRGGLDNG